MEKNPELDSFNIANELIEMAKRDQEMRKKAREHSDLYDESIDKENTMRLEEIIEEIGWPHSSKVGKEAAHSAWLLAQHADHNPEFQERCLELLSKSIDSVESSDIAFLTDRVRVNTGKMQLYGTQFNENNEPHPIENPSSLDDRRNAVGLEPFEEYKKLMNDLKANNQ